jgi:hypothetical protein
MDQNEAGHRAVVGPLHGVGEKAGRELVLAPVVAQAFAAEAFAGARFIAAVAAVLVGFSGAGAHGVLRDNLIY